MLVTNKYKATGIPPNNDSPLIVPATKPVETLAKLLLRVNVTDYTNGFRIYSRKSANLIVKKCGNIGDGFIVLSEILLTIDTNGLKIDEVPSIFINRKRGESSVNFLLIVQSLIGVIKLYLIKNKILIK